MIDFEDNKIINFNIGDSRLLIVNSINKCEFLLQAHNVKNLEELSRIKRINNLAFYEGRLGGSLLLTRSIGDLYFAKFGLISEPDFFCLEIKEKTIMILASDGLWDVC